jgi:hypothetical protein
LSADKSGTNENQQNSEYPKMDDHATRADEAKKNEFRRDVMTARLFGEQRQMLEHGKPFQLAAALTSSAKPIGQPRYR